jgi:hypothetical protein
MLPTSWEKPRVGGIVFTGDGRRTVEFVGASAALVRPPPGRRRPSSLFGLPPPEPAAVSDKEHLILANLPIPSGLSEYYFEVTIEKAGSSSAISIGLSPERATTWIDGSYRYTTPHMPILSLLLLLASASHSHRYQANGKKTTIVGGSRRQENYGSFYRAGNVIGCRYNRDER